MDLFWLFFNLLYNPLIICHEAEKKVSCNVSYIEAKDVSVIYKSLAEQLLKENGLTGLEKKNGICLTFLNAKSLKGECETYAIHIPQGPLWYRVYSWGP